MVDILAFLALQMLGLLSNVGQFFPKVLVSISPTFYEQLLRQNPFGKQLQTQIVST
jgi:hypothetical protein